MSTITEDPVSEISAQKCIARDNMGSWEAASQIVHGHVIMLVEKKKKEKKVKKKKKKKKGGGGWRAKLYNDKVFCFRRPFLH